MPRTLPFANVKDVEARWHPLTEAERERCKTLIGDATQIIKDECPRWETASPRTRRMIVVAMVKRAMNTDDQKLGVTNSQQTAGSFSESFTYSNPMGDLYLTKAERNRLGSGRGKAFHLDMAGHSAPDMNMSDPLGVPYEG